MDLIGAHRQGIDEALGEQPHYLKSLKGLTNLFDRAMGEEGIDPAVRDRVIARVLHGTPTPEESGDWADPEPQDLAVVEALAASPGLMHGGASVRRTLDESR